MHNLIRYPNRKLYSKNKGSYVNLSDILEFIKNGDSVQVLTSKTKEDITEITLKQAIASSNKTKIPSNILEDLIRNYI